MLANLYIAKGPQGTGVIMMWEEQSSSPARIPKPVAEAWYWNRSTCRVSAMRFGFPYNSVMENLGIDRAEFLRNQANGWLDNQAWLAFPQALARLSENMDSGQAGGECEQIKASLIRLGAESPELLERMESKSQAPGLDELCQEANRLCSALQVNPIES